MSEGRPARAPEADAWVAAVHASEDDFEPLGSALVIAEDRVLTCAHVIMREGVVRDSLWVAFPKAGDCPRRRVTAVRSAYARVRDVAVLVLDEPAPAGAGPAPLRFPLGQDLVGRTWWAFGFPDRDPFGDSADGQVGAALSYGWVRLDTSSRYLIRPGFSGGGLWSPDYQAVVGIVGQAHANGDGRAVTLHQADLDLPEVKLAALAKWSAEAAGEAALAQWGWALDRDPEGVRHWRPRARGVSIDSERGWRFRGRAAALTRITSWLDRPQPDRRVLVVTGSPGVGKSAVLGRVVTTADAGIRSSLPPGDTGVMASVGSVSCAVHAKGKTALEVAEEIARAASAKLPGQLEELAPALRDALATRPGSRFNLIIDALDEAVSPAQARAVIDSVVLPLAETFTDAGVQVAVGTRRRDDGGDLLGRFGPALELLDLDDPRYFAGEDLAAYALACLKLAGDERPGNPYADDTLAIPLATRIGQVSEQNFLIAGLIARSHGLHDEQPADPTILGTEGTVRTALAAYLDHLPDLAGVPAGRLLTALAFAEAPGLPAGLWQLAVRATYGADVSAQDLARFARSSAANFLVETTGAAVSGPPDPGVAPVYRLFHQALNDALLHDRADLTPRRADERSLVRALTAYGQAGQWQDAPDYLLRSLPAHAQAAGLVDDLLTDDAYLLHADLRRLIQVADDASFPAARRRARLLRLTPQAITAASAERAALFSVTEALENLGTTYRDSRWQAPYRAQWAVAQPRSERASFKGHQGRVYAACAVTVEGRALLASGGSDGTVRLWDPRTGEQLTALEGHQRGVYAVCAVTVEGRALLASGGGDGMVRLWDPRSGEQLTVLEGHQRGVRAVCAVRVEGRPLLASGGSDGTVLLWDPRTGEQLTVLEGHQRGVGAVCAVRVEGRALLASGGGDGTVRLWDPLTGEQLTALEGHQRGVSAVCAVRVEGRELLASGSGDGTVRLWDPRSGGQLTVLEGHQGGVSAVCAVRVEGRELLASGSGDGMVLLWDPRGGGQLTALEGHQGGVYAVCAVTVEGRPLLASGSGDGTVRLWDPLTGEQLTVLEGHQRGVRAVCAVRVEGRELLASGGGDGTVRLWDPGGGGQLTVLEGHQRGVYAVCAVTVEGRALLATGGSDGTVRLWDPRTGEPLTALEGHLGWVNAVCAVRVEDRELLASGSIDGMVLLWDPRGGGQLTSLEGHQGGVYALCAVRVEGRELLASGSSDGTVRLWDPLTGEQLTVLEGHQDWVRAVCAVTVDGRELLASGSADGMVLLWDPRTGTCTATVPTHHQALGVAVVPDSLAIGLDIGILVIKAAPVA
jgi:WD40 repeat protein